LKQLKLGDKKLRPRGHDLSTRFHTDVLIESKYIRGDTQTGGRTDRMGDLVYVILLYFKIYKTIILPVVLYGCEISSLTLREEHRLRKVENRVLRRTFGPKRDEVTGEWRKLHSEELHILYSSPNSIRHIKSRRMRWAGHVAHMGEECVQGFDGKARRKETT
jgi:hypothetical protein